MARWNCYYPKIRSMLQRWGNKSITRTWLRQTSRTPWIEHLFLCSYCEHEINPKNPQFSTVFHSSQYILLSEKSTCSQEWVFFFWVETVVLSDNPPLQTHIRYYVNLEIATIKAIKYQNLRGNTFETVGIM